MTRIETDKETAIKEPKKKLSDKQQRKYEEAYKLSKYFHLMRVKDGDKTPMDTEWDQPTREKTDFVIKQLEKGKDINYALVMLNDFIAIDLDHIYDEETYPKYCEFYEKYNLDTLRTRTPSMGYHFIFKVSKYAFKRMEEIGKNSLQDKNLAGWVDTRHGNGYVVAPACSLENNYYYKKGGTKHVFVNNEYELLDFKEPAYISNELVDFIIDEKQKKNDTKRAKKGKTKKTVINNSNKNEEKEEKPEKKEVSKKEKQRRQHLKKVVENNLLTEEEVNTIDKIVNLIDREHLRDYYDALYICFSLGSLGDRLFDICINLMKRADENLEEGEKKKFGYDWVEDNFNKNKKAFFNEPLSGNHMTIDYALWLAGECNGEKYNSLVRKLLKKQKTNNLNLEEVFNVEEKVKKTIYPSNLENKKDVVVNEYENDFVEEYPIDDYNIIIFRSKTGSGKTTNMKKCLDHYKPKRVLFISCRIVYAYNMMSEFSDYGFYNYKDPDVDVNEVDKLFCSLESLHKLNKDNVYDLVILDESETILNTFDGKTVRDNGFYRIKRVFFYLLKNCKKIISNDAFTCNRTIDFLRKIRISRKDKKVYLSLNHKKPPKRNCYVIKNRGRFEDLLFRDLEDGKKIILHSTGKKVLKTIQGDLEKRGYKVLIYHADMDDNLKIETAKDVNNHWAEYDLVCYSPSITTGVSFMKPDYFDKKYFIGGTGSCVVRSSIQAIDRCRTTISGDLIIHFLTKSSDKQRFLETNKKSIMERFEYEKKEIQELRRFYEIEQEELEEDNSWMNKIRLFNAKEKQQSESAYSKVFLFYLEQLYYDITFDNHVPTEKEKKNMVKFDCKTDLDYDDIPAVTDQDDIDELERNIRRNCATEIEKAKHDKARFLKKFFEGRNLEEGVGVEDLKKLWEFWCNNEKFLRNLQNELRGRSKYIGKEKLNQDNMCLSTIDSYPEITNILRILGLSDTADDSVTFTEDDFLKKEEELRPFIDKAYKKLNIRDKNTNNQKPGLKVKKQLNRIFRDFWSGCYFGFKRTSGTDEVGRKYSYSIYKIKNPIGVDKDIIKNKYDDNTFRDRNIFNVLGKGNGNR